MSNKDFVMLEFRVLSYLMKTNNIKESELSVLIEKHAAELRELQICTNIMVIENIFRILNY